MPKEAYRKNRHTTVPRNLYVDKVAPYNTLNIVLHGHTLVHRSFGK